MQNSQQNARSCSAVNLPPDIDVTDMLQNSVNKFLIDGNGVIYKYIGYTVSHESISLLMQKVYPLDNEVVPFDNVGSFSIISRESVIDLLTNIL